MFCRLSRRAIRQNRCVTGPSSIWAILAGPAALFKQHEPEVLLYCHAVCDVPRCEVAPGWAREINIVYLQRVLDALPSNTRLVYVSSDHVFGGDGVYDEHASPCPVSVYGRTRVEAEEMVLARPESLVLRVGLAIGPSPNGRTGHWDWLRYRSAQSLPMTIVHDEYRSVVWAHDLAARVMQFAESSETGLRHITATRALSRVELAHHLMSRFGLGTKFQYESRHERAAPHLGRVELASAYCGALFKPLPSVIDEPTEIPVAQFSKPRLVFDLLNKTSAFFRNNSQVFCLS